MSKCDCPPAMGGRFLLSGAGLLKNMYKSRKSVLLELLNIEICAILYNVYPKRKGNLTLLHYDAILFDVDGTLIDSAPGILNTLEEVFSSMGVDVARSDLGRYIGPPLRKSFGEHFSDPAKIEEATKRYRVSYAAKGCHEGDVYPGVVEMLGRLKAAGLTLCTATCKPTDVVRPILEEQGLAPYFSFVGGASMDESRDNKTDVIRHVLAQPVMQGKRVLMVGDRRDDMQGAVNCGLDAAAVLYGYGGREEVASFAPVFMAADCKELTDWALRPVDEPSHS